MQGADHESAQLLLLELVDRDRTRATGVVAPPAPPYLLLSHGEEFEERVRLASEAAARFDLYVELLCLEAVDRVVVEYFDVSVGRWVQSSRAAAAAARAARAVRAVAAAAGASAARSAAAKETQSARELGGIAAAVGEYYTRSVVAWSCMCALSWMGGALSCASWMSTRT